MLKLYTLGEEVLREKCENVEVFDQELSDFIDQMFIKMKESEGIGLAAPQVGVSKNIFVIEIDKKLEFINPKIIQTSTAMQIDEEGCLSIPGFYKEIQRYKEVVVQAQRRDGKFFKLRAKDLLARAIQHESDHLKGILFIDYLDEEEQMMVKKKLGK